MCQLHNNNNNKNNIRESVFQVIKNKKKENDNKQKKKIPKMSLPITTTDYPLPETTVSSGELYAEYISAPASSMSPAAIAEHMQQNQITFEIPTAHDLRHIDALHSFNTLLQRIGNAAVSYDSSPPASISTEQLSNSAVLDLADLREHNDADANSVWEQIFGDADMHAIVNYLWIGVVTSLVLLSLVFIMFSCYFYRKFRTWKKCSKYSRTDAPCPCPPPPLLCADLVTFIKMLSLSLFFFSVSLFGVRPYQRPFIQLFWLPG